MPLKNLVTLAAIATLLSLWMRRQRNSGLRAYRPAGQAADALQQAAFDAASHEPSNILSPAACEIDGLVVGPGVERSAPVPSEGRRRVGLGTA